VRLRLLAFVGTAVVLTVSNNFFGDQSAGCRGVNRSSGASLWRPLHFCKVLKCQVNLDGSHQLSGMQRDQRPQPKEVEAAVSVQTNEPAKKRPLYDYDYAL